MTRNHHWGFRVVVLIGLVVASCTPTTGTRVSLNPSNLSKIKSIGVVVTKEEDFSVRLSREEGTATGAALFGLIGAGIEAAARDSSDKQVEEQFKSIVADYNPNKPMSDRLRHHLRESGSFNTIADGALLRSKELDASLEVTIREWGLRRCAGKSGTVQVGFNLYARVVLVDNGSTVWERNELYLDGECRPWQEFKANGRLLKSVFARSIDNVSGKIVNEFLFP